MTDRSRNRDREESPRRGRNEEESPRRGRDDAPRGRDRDDSGSDRSRGRGRSSFEYQSRNADDTRARAESGGNDYDKLLKPGCKSWKPNDGDNRIRILPPTWKNAKHFGFDCHIHYGVGADNGAYLDLFKMKGEDDPIHEEYMKAKSELDPENKDDQEYLRQLKGTRRDLIYLVDRDNEREGVQAWFMPFGLGNDVVKLSIDKQSREVLEIDHPDEGYDVEFTKTGKGINTKYSAPAIARRSSPLGKDEWLEYVVENPLPDQLNFYDYDHIAVAFGGGGKHKQKSRDRDEDDESAHSGKHRSSGRDRDDEPKNRGRDNNPVQEVLSWEDIHDMTGKELDALIENEKLDINPDEAKDDDDLADWICEEMKITKSEKKPGRRVVADEDDQASRLRELRKNRRD